jgi:hypothetical protein
MKEFLMPCICSTCFKRLINWAVAAKRKYPNRQIMVRKINLKLVFWQCNLSAAAAIQCCTKLPAEDLILLYLCLTFGGSPCPKKWGTFLEPICDLATAILHDDSWDPTNCICYPKFSPITKNDGQLCALCGNPQQIH